MTEEYILFWFGFKQTIPSPPGNVILCGPYNTYDEAKKERENAKQWDCEVSAPFAAKSEDEALKKAQRLM